MSALTALFLLPGIGLAATAPDATSPASKWTEPAPAEGRVIVRFDRPTTLTEAAASLEGTPFVVDRALMGKIDLYLVLFGEEVTVPEAVARLEELPGVRYAAPDMPVEPRALPNDTYFPFQWGMNNTGQTGGTPDADIDAVEAWDLGTGSRDFVIAIVDGGAQTDHIDLLANRWQNDVEVNGASGVDDDLNGYVDDLYGWNAYNDTGSIPLDSHGTHVAGIAGARGNNALGVSGVNQGANLAQDITYSGTVTAAMEAAIFGVPAIAVSLDSHTVPDFDQAAAFAAHLTPIVLDKGLPELTLLNVNVPLGEIKGVEVTWQGRRRYHDELVKRIDPKGRPYYWIGGDRPTGDTEEGGTDVWAVAQGYVSITPIVLDMTARNMLEAVADWEIEAALKV